jgi:CheY-like chemotaxis protein
MTYLPIEHYDMTKKVPCIMLIDDSESDNYYHEIIIKRNNSADKIIIKESGEQALDYLRSAKQNGDPNPDLIFLDINMPGMSGWQFLEHYNQLDKELQGKVIVVMLTAYDDHYDRQKSTRCEGLIKYKTKPLTKEMLDEVYDTHFVTENSNP